MSYWLLKTEPGTYSFADLVRDKQTVWDGVTNNLALKNIRSMKKGDLCFVYHTGDEKAIVGIAEVVSDPTPDPRKSDPRLAVVRLKSGKKLSRPVTLAEIRLIKELSTFSLVRLPRLSVMPVDSRQWTMLLSMSEKG
jgi:predicted RNA-binding protein with PUA-like domain